MIICSSANCQLIASWTCDNARMKRTHCIRDPTFIIGMLFYTETECLRMSASFWGSSQVDNCTRRVLEHRIPTDSASKLGNVNVFFSTLFRDHRLQLRWFLDSCLLCTKAILRNSSVFLSSLHILLSVTLHVRGCVLWRLFQCLRPCIFGRKKFWWKKWILWNHTMTFQDLWSRKELCDWTGTLFCEVRTHF